MKPANEASIPFFPKYSSSITRALTVLSMLALALTTLICRANDLSPRSEPQRSSDGLFEVYQTSANVGKDVDGKPYPAGTNLFLRPASSKTRGALLRQNDRWMDQQWCPGTHLLGVEDHWDGHQSDVYVYEVNVSPRDHATHYRLVFKSPSNDYDRKWTIIGWKPKSREIHLKMEQRGNDGILGHEHWPPFIEGSYTFRIGTIPLIDSRYP